VAGLLPGRRLQVDALEVVAVARAGLDLRLRRRPRQGERGLDAGPVLEANDATDLPEVARFAGEKSSMLTRCPKTPLAASRTMSPPESAAMALSQRRASASSSSTPMRRAAATMRVRSWAGWLDSVIGLRGSLGAPV